MTIGWYDMFNVDVTSKLVTTTTRLQKTLDLYSQSRPRMSYCKISWSLGFRLLTGTSAAMLRCLSNFREIWSLQNPISWLRDFTRFGGKCLPLCEWRPRYFFEGCKWWNNVLRMMWSNENVKPVVLFLWKHYAWLIHLNFPADLYTPHRLFLSRYDAIVQAFACPPADCS